MRLPFKGMRLCCILRRNLWIDFLHADSDAIIFGYIDIPLCIFYLQLLGSTAVVLVNFDISLIQISMKK